MIIITVARRPLEGTVARNALTWGCGGLNIEASRVSSDGLHTVTQGKGTHGDDGWGMGRSVYQVPTGRWPANLILSHMPGCEMIGKHTIGNPNQVQKERGVRPGGFGNVGAEKGSSNPNGPMYLSETVDTWQCVDGCPVAGMDQQSGDRPGATSFSRPSKYNASSYQVGNAPLQPGYGDSGGASRFFRVFPSHGNKQVTGTRKEP